MTDNSNTVPLPPNIAEYWDEWPRFKDDWDECMRFRNRVFDPDVFYKWYGVKRWDYWFEKECWTVEEAVELERCIKPDPSEEEIQRPFSCGEARALEYEFTCKLLERDLRADIGAEKIPAVPSKDTFLVKPLDFVRWRLEHAGLGPAPKAFVRFFDKHPELDHEVSDVPRVQTCDGASDTGEPHDTDRRGTNTTSYTEVMNRALFGALWLLVKKHTDFLRGSKLNAAQLAKAVLDENYRAQIWKTHHVCLPAQSTIAERLNNSLRLAGTRPRLLRSHPESHDVQVECFLMSVIWCVSHDRERCVRDERLNVPAIVAMISEYKEKLWPNNEYQRGLEKDERKMLDQIAYLISSR